LFINIREKFYPVAQYHDELRRVIQKAPGFQVLHGPRSTRVRRPVLQNPGLTRRVRGETAPQRGQEETDGGRPPFQASPQRQAIDAAYVPPAVGGLPPAGLPLQPRAIQRAQEHTDARAPGIRGSAAAPEAPQEPSGWGTSTRWRSSSRASRPSWTPPSRRSRGPGPRPRGGRTTAARGNGTRRPR